MLDQFNVTQTSVAANSWSTCINRKEVIRHEKLFLQLKKKIKMFEMHWTFPFRTCLHFKI